MEGKEEQLMGRLERKVRMKEQDEEKVWDEKMEVCGRKWKANS